MNSKRIGVGVVGVGRHGERISQLLSTIESARLVAVADANKAKAETTAQKYGAKSYADYTDMINRPDIDLIGICSPPQFHAEMTIAAAEAGKHIFCEKPMSTTLREADEMIKAAKSAGVKLSIGFNERFNGHYLEAKRLIETGGIGKPVMLRGNMRVSKDTWKGLSVNEWVLDTNRGGGVITEMIIHIFDLFRWFTEREVKRVYAEADTLVLKNVKCEDHAVVVLRFEDNAIGVVDGSYGMPSGVGWDVRMEAIGDKGAIYINMWPQSTVLYFDGRGIEYPDLFSYDTIMSSHRRELEHIVNCILTDEEPLATGEDGRASLEIALAAVESIQQNKPVQLPL